MKNITIYLFAGMLIAICPGLSSALDFGISDISRQHDDINWDVMNTLSNSTIISVSTSDTSPGFRTNEGSGGFIQNPIPGDTDPNFDPEAEDQGATAPVPEPITMLLLGTGLIGIVSMRKRFSRKG
jgi:hypothetical protein